MINKLTIDSTGTVSDLCQIMAHNRSDKSPLVTPLLSRTDPNSHGAASIIDNLTPTPLEYAHGYTGVYDFLFSPFRDKEIKFGEIGVQYNHSIRGWREYFPKAEIHGFEWVNSFLESARNDNLDNVYYHWTDVYQTPEIHKAFQEAGGKFDIIIEDSCHHLETQINCVEVLHEYLNPGGILVIEDIFPLIKNKEGRGHGDYVEEELASAIEPFIENYSNVTFVSPKHKYEYNGLYGEVKLLILYK